MYVNWWTFSKVSEEIFENDLKKHNKRQKDIKLEDLSGSPIKVIVPGKKLKTGKNHQVNNIRK